MLKSKFLSVVLLLVSISLTLIVGEGLSRLIVNPVDFLKPRVSPDPILGYKIPPGSAGHDKWGFRNRYVPASADIVAIGDSQTYGVSAVASQSWPAQLSRITGAEVYNLALGGYGAMEYDYLLRKQAMQLNPKIIVVGIYLGNDFIDAFRTVYGRPGWEHLRASHKNYPLPKGNALQAEDPVKIFGGIREWFSCHSVIYRMATFSMGGLFHRLEVKYQEAHKTQTTKRTVVLSDHSGRLITVFTPDTTLSVLNTASPEVQEGIRLTGDTLVGMKDFCNRKQIRFLVIFLPTKESVYWPLIVKMSQQPEKKLVQLVVQQETSAKAILMDRLEKSGVCFEDVLADLRAKVEKEALYPNNADNHPNRYGYQVIAEKVARVLATDRRCENK